MIEVLPGRKSIKGSFGEDVGIVGVLGWEGDIIFLGSDSKFSG